MKKPSLTRYLKRRLKEEPKLDVAQYKRGWYAVGRALAKKRRCA